MIWPDICERCGEPHEQPLDGMTRAEPCADRLALLSVLRARPHLMYVIGRRLKVWYLDYVRPTND